MKLKNNLKDINDAIHQKQFSGVCSIRKDHEVILEEVNGYLDWANKIPVNIQTKFGIASGTKLFTALGIMRLIEDEKCQLSDKIFKYIPNQFPLYDQGITIKHLLTHTSGLPDYYDEDNIGDEGFFLETPWYDLKKPSDYLTILPNKDMLFEPGSEFKYNDSGFVLLAMIIEVITGDYHQWIKEVVLDKVGMNDSGFFLMNRLPKNTAYGYQSISNEPYMTNVYHLPIIGGGDGGMFTTVKDMDIFWDALMKGNIISKPLLKQMLTPYEQGEGLSYGLGVWLKETDKGLMPLIIGEDIGVSFESGYHPSKGITYTIISNTQNGAWPIAKLVNLKVNL